MSTEKTPEPDLHTSYDFEEHKKVMEHQTIHRFAMSPKLYAQLRQKFNSNENPIVVEEVKTNTILEIWRIE